MPQPSFLDEDPEPEIYDLVSWDMPGLKNKGRLLSHRCWRSPGSSILNPPAESPA